MSKFLSLLLLTSPVVAAENTSAASSSLGRSSTLGDVGSSSASQLDLAATFGSLVFVIIFILFLAWLLKRMRLPSMTGRDGLKIVRQLPVGTKERLMIVQAGEEQFLIGITAQSINMLSRLEKPLKDEESAPLPFASQLSQLLKKDETK
ncbi:flagellar biosynthetic protein FliO [Vibrio tapetis]|uniref:Flagellar protein n=1 Tax=Vibrio tapetis subsp. tapetis TaxID=1671868 RepID=A0A2N8ZE52_9VIBR|nr:flagellar biosynthetic protein FliO [Vibrio tapetis]SON50191.1 Putative Flagellar biosynthesis protein FliO (modular protein) [Vibrio tapetis subsp. tapetis]